MAEEERALTSAIVLAAGRGERMGGPKALLVVDGEPLLVRHVERFLEAGCNDVVVVTREEIATRIAERLVALGDRARVVVSNEPEPRGSLTIGVRALATTCARVLVTPVDALPAAPETIRALLDALDQAEAATPEVRTASGTRGGHPVACRVDVLLAYREGDRVPTLRDRLASLGSRRVRVAVEDEAIAADLDTPEDLARLTGSPPRFY